MSDRFPPVSPAALTPEQKPIHELLVDRILLHFQDTFTTCDDNGALVGLFTHFLYLPLSVVSGYAGNYKALGNIPSFPLKCREIAILAVGEHFGAQYELYSHARVAKKVGIPDTQIRDILEGRPPSEGTEEEVLSWQMARELVGAGGSFKKGQLSESLWDRGEKAFGKEGLGALIHYIGFYAYTCIILNAGATSVPEGETIWPTSGKFTMPI
ncbi:hypothetical protein TWF481_006527 [Arthrobotrys musiformis]|uniref:Carboxymuconolactone decarboxylase-like domain-containing protein n=1 Tax=Arthrobotrys musiformis TaxID=47236 RepID=A0AAV9WAH1_9PEZI